MDKVTRLKCLSTLTECEKHSARLETALKRLAGSFPLTQKTLNALINEQIAVLDQFIYRFTKLQDCIGLTLIPALYRLLEDDSTVHPFVDILNRLEKLGVLSSVEDWQYFRTLRNTLAHEYPERAEDVTNAINALYSA